MRRGIGRLRLAECDTDFPPPHLRQDPALGVVVLGGPRHDVKITPRVFMGIKETVVLHDCHDPSTLLIKTGV